MTRPVLIDDLISSSQDQISKPKFLKKSQRGGVNESNIVFQSKSKKRKFDINNGDDDDDNDNNNNNNDHNKDDTIKPKTVKQKNKFNFEWNEDEDTSNGYKPLVELDYGDDDLALSLKPWWDKSLSEMTQRDWRVFNEEYSINIRTSSKVLANNPLRNWQESDISPEVLDMINKLGYHDPTPIQRAAIPNALAVKDIIGIAETGSGKTLAFLVPLMNYLLKIDDNYLKYEHSLEENSNKPLGLVLAPTRELAIQITQESIKLGEALGFNTLSIIGGHRYEETINSTKNGVHIVVATPGRLIDSLEQNLLNLLNCYYLIMDEADRMIDMGFEKSLQRILSYLPSNDSLNRGIHRSLFKTEKRITQMFTATISPPIEQITKNYLVDPVYLRIGNINQKGNNIDQQFEFLGTEIQTNNELNKLRSDRLIQIIKNHINSNPKYSIVIFANFKMIVEELSYLLSQKQLTNVTIHGSKSQQAREKAIEEFRSSKVSILVATDIAARGIDIPNVSLVINYQMTKKFDEYIHRIGRTGRAGKKGTSFTFIDNSNEDLLMDLKKFLTKGKKKLPKWLQEHGALLNRYIKD